MHCEVCGREISWGYLVDIEGARLIACADCAERGTIIRKVYDRPRETRKRRDSSEESEKDYVLIDNYGEVIRRARESKGIDLETLAKRLRVREGYLRKVEEGELTPTDDLAHRLEKVLGVKLFEEVEEDDAVPVSEETGTLTLGDVVKLSWGRKR